LTHQEQKSLVEQLLALEESFVQGERDGESDAELASVVIELVLQRERLRHGVNVGTVRAAALDKATLAKMASWDSDDPTMSTLEKVFRRLATNRGYEAVALLKRAVADRVRAVSEDQRRKAKAPRPKHPIVVLIEEIVRGKPEISAHELKCALRAQSGKDVIAYVDKEHIYPVDASFRDVTFESLKDRLTLARKRFVKAG